MKKILTSICAALLLFSITASAAVVGKPFFRNWSAMEYGGHNRNFDIVCDTTGRVFVANFEGLAIYDGTGWEILHTPGISRVTSLLAATDGKIYFGGSNLLGFVTPGGNTASYIADDTDIKIRFGEISNIYETDGTICFANTSGQSWTVKDGSVVENDELQSPVSGRSDVLRIAGTGMIATAIADKGLSIKTEKDEELYSLSSSDDLCSDNINAMAYDGKGSLWGATDNGIFVVNLSPVFTQYTKTDGLTGQVTDILLYEGHLYVGTLQGLFLLGNDNRFTRIEGITLACWKISQGNGSLIASTAQGLYEIKGDKANSLSNRHTLCAIHDTNSVWYTGELNGIYRHSATDDVLIAEITNTVNLSKDSDGNIWAITLANETFCKKSGSSSFEPAENKSLSLLFSFTDSKGRVWHSADGNHGLSAEGISDRMKKWCEPLKEYDIQAMEVGQDRIWVGGSFGLICMDSEKIEQTDPFAPVLQVRSFTQNGNDVSLSFANDKIDAFGKTLYSYRMHENDEWTPWNSNQDLNFSNMMGGDYQFTARSIDAHGNIATGETVRFRIPRPIYFRWYAIILYIILLVLIIAGIFRLRIHQAEQRQKELEAQVKERTSQLEAAQNALIKQEREATVGKLTKGLIDRILNPMNYINNFSHLTTGLLGDLKGNLEQNQDQMNTDDYEDSLDILDMMGSNLSKIANHGMSTTRILKAMEELLKDRRGKTEQTNINSLCQQTIEVFSKYFEKDIQDCRIRVECKLCETPVMCELVAEQFGNVLKYMLGNSIYAIRKKFEKQAYEPVVRLSLEKGETPLVKIYDNGIGIEDTIKDKVFDPFFTTKPTGEAPGIGLYMSQQIIQDFGGTISFESRKDEFTEFSIKLK